MSAPTLAVLTTLATPDDARSLARVLLERRLVACAQLNAIESLYRWDGAVQQEPEVRLLLKTTQDRYAELEATIRELHPYELPAICALPLAPIEPAFAAWIAAETAPEP